MNNLYIFSFNNKLDQKGSNSQVYVVSQTLEMAIQDFYKSDKGKDSLITNIELSMYPVIGSGLAENTRTVLSARRYNPATKDYE